MFAAIVGTGLVYGATWIARKAPTVVSAVLPLLYLKEKKKADHLQEVAEAMDIQLKQRISPYYDEAVELSLIVMKNVPQRLRYLEGKKLVVTDEEMFFLSKLVEAVNNEEETPFDISKFVRASEERLKDPELAKQFL